jgi:hypothetical protein
LVAGFKPFGVPLLKSAFSPQAAGAFMGLWAIAGIPGAGANSSDGVGGAIPTSATAGAIPFSNVSNTYMARLFATATITGQLFLYDRLWHNSGLSPTSLGAQTVNSTTLTRPDATGADVEAWMQVYGTLGAGSTAPTISYTDQDGNAGNTGTLQGFVTTAATNRCFVFSLAAGDTGVRSIETYTNGATMTSGTFGLILRRLVTSCGIPVANTPAVLDPIGAGLPRIYDSACLELVWTASATSSVVLFGNVLMAQG